MGSLGELWTEISYLSLKQQPWQQPWKIIPQIWSRYFWKCIVSSIVDSSCSLPIKSWLFPDKAEGDKWLLLQNVPDLRLWQSERYQRVELCKLSLSSPLTPFPYYFIYFLSRRGQIFGKSLLRDSPSLRPKPTATWLFSKILADSLLYEGDSSS